VIVIRLSVRVVVGVVANSSRIPGTYNALLKLNRDETLLGSMTFRTHFQLFILCTLST
jgi:hypothetical protein